MTVTITDVTEALASINGNVFDTNEDQTWQRDFDITEIIDTTGGPENCAGGGAGFGGERVRRRVRQQQRAPGDGRRSDHRDHRCVG
ncbi:MAG: hypothetical protein R2715_00775 [Ilumatobacteraceae bacterium]